MNRIQAKLCKAQSFSSSCLDYGSWNGNYQMSLRQKQELKIKMELSLLRPHPDKTLPNLTHPAKMAFTMQISS